MWPLVCQLYASEIQTCINITSAQIGFDKFSKEDDTKLSGQEKKDKISEALAEEEI